MKNKKDNADQTMEARPALICIPDISGFTKFMSEADFELSSKIIPALLNEIIYSNEIGLKVSEIEGDAVLFYKFGEMPSLSAIITQCKRFYSDFYGKLKTLSDKNEDTGDFSLITEHLGLKIILHFGKEVGMTQIGNRIKLIGEEVIVAHRFLKNDLKSKEYILISSDLLDQFDAKHVQTLKDQGEIRQMEMMMEHIGTVKYYFIDLKP